MARWLLVLVLLAWGGAAASQTVIVRAGEHDDFTRLVFNLPARIPFDVRRSESSADIVFERGGMSMDTSVVFRRVPTTRLTGISASPDGSTVRLDLVCDCPVETFWYAQSSLVVDIRSPPADAVEEGRDRPASAGEEATRMVLDPLPLPDERPSAASRLAARRLAPSAQMAGVPPGQVAEALLQSRDLLLRELGRAASQGLLTPRVTAPPPLPDRPAAADDTETSDARSTAGSMPEPAVPYVQLRAETSIDRASAGLAQVRRGPAANTCLDESRVDVPAWASDAPFRKQVAPLRARLVGEFDSPDRSAVLSLARLYIHFGFGAEARQVLRELPGGDAPDPVLQALADILESGHAGPGSPLAGQMDCAPMTALWSVLSYPEIPAGQPLDADAAIRGFAALPPHLRAYLGPGLARRFHDGGLPREGAVVRRILKRNEETMTPEGALLEAEITLSEGKVNEAEAAFDDIVEDNADPSARALLQLVNARLSRGVGISYETAQLAGAYAVEYRGQPLGRDLAEAYVTALAASGAFDEAFAELNRVLGQDIGGQAEIRLVLTDILTRQADDYDFLHHTLSGSVPAPENLDAKTGNRLAGRLLSLGFIAAAERFAAPPASGAAQRQRQLLRSRIELTRQRPRQALVDLLGLTGKDANLLRAEARSMVGEHAAARVLFEAAGREDAAAREAWLGRDWDRVTDSDEPALAALARLKREPDHGPDGQKPGVLEQDRRLLSKSRDTRGVIDQLLAAYPAPVGAN